MDPKSQKAAELSKMDAKNRNTPRPIQETGTNDRISAKGISPRPSPYISSSQRLRDYIDRNAAYYPPNETSSNGSDSYNSFIRSMERRGKLIKNIEDETSSDEYFYDALENSTEGIKSIDLGSNENSVAKPHIPEKQPSFQRVVQRCVERFLVDLKNTNERRQEIDAAIDKKNMDILKASYVNPANIRRIHEPYKLPKIDTYAEDFQVIKHLGHGSYGAVGLLQVVKDHNGSIPHEFRLQKDNLIVAKRMLVSNIKKMTTPFDKEWEAFQAFGIPGHQNIVAGWCVQHPSKEDPWGHIFMEYCDMGNVDALLDRYLDDGYDDIKGYTYGPDSVPPEELAYEIMASVAAGLAWMHNGVRSWRHIKESPAPKDWEPWMHNDLKFDNIFMKARQKGDDCIWPIFKIGDLGGATTSKRNAEVGNNSSVAPDRIKGHWEVPSTPKDDIYSLGSIMHYFTNRIDPFEGEKKVHELAVSKLGYPIGGAPNCGRSKVEHINRTVESDEYWLGCAEYHYPTFDKRSKAEFPSQYAAWWNELIEECISMERDKRPDAVELGRRIWNGIERHGFGSGGNRKVLWYHGWLEEGMEILDAAVDARKLNSCMIS